MLEEGGQEAPEERPRSAMAAAEQLGRRRQQQEQRLQSLRGWLGPLHQVADPLWLQFRDPVWEREFRVYQARTMAKVGGWAAGRAGGMERGRVGRHMAWRPGWVGELMTGALRLLPTLPLPYYVSLCLHHPLHAAGRHWLPDCSHLRSGTLLVPAL